MATLGRVLDRRRWLDLPCGIRSSGPLGASAVLFAIRAAGRAAQ